MKIKLDPGAYMPERAHLSDAGLDLRATDDVLVPAYGQAIVDTGVHVAIPRGFVGMLTSRSGIMARHGITCRGTIDSGYTGSIHAVLVNHSNSCVCFAKGDKVTQLVIVPCAADELELVDELPETERGDGGFGSTDTECTGDACPIPGVNE